MSPNKCGGGWKYRKYLQHTFNEKETVLQFIKAELVGYCQNGQYICDEIGAGAIKIL